MLNISITLFINSGFSPFRFPSSLFMVFTLGLVDGFCQSLYVLICSASRVKLGQHHIPNRVSCGGWESRPWRTTLWFQVTAAPLTSCAKSFSCWLGFLIHHMWVVIIYLLPRVVLEFKWDNTGKVAQPCLTHNVECAQWVSISCYHHRLHLGLLCSLRSENQSPCISPFSVQY